MEYVDFMRHGMRVADMIRLGHYDSMEITQFSVDCWIRLKDSYDKYGTEIANDPCLPKKIFSK